MAARSEVAQNAAPGSKLASSLIPREHGAWLILLIPMLAGTVLSAAELRGFALLRLLLVTVGALCAFTGGSAAEAVLRRNQSVRCSTPVVAVLAISACCGVGLLLTVQRHAMLSIIILIAPVLLIRVLAQVAAGKNRPDKTIMGELLATIILTATGPAARAALCDRFDSASLWLWVLSVAFFSGGIVYVKMQLAAAKYRANWGTAKRVNISVPTLGWIGLMLASALLLMSRQPFSGSRSIRWLVLCAFGPGFIRACIGIMRLQPRVPVLKRVGMIEAALATAFLCAVIPLVNALTKP